MEQFNKNMNVEPDYIELIEINKRYKEALEKIKYYGSISENAYYKIAKEALME